MGIGFALGNGRAKALKINAFIRLGPVDLIAFRKITKRTSQVGVVDGPVYGLFEFLFHQLLPPRSSITIIMSRLGPWTPMVRTLSMSAVRLGPVIMEI